MIYYLFGLLHARDNTLVVRNTHIVNLEQAVANKAPSWFCCIGLSMELHCLRVGSIVCMGVGWLANKTDTVTITLSC